MVVAAGLIATWSKMTSKMSEWDKIIPNLATMDAVEASVKASINQLKIDLLQSEAAKKDIELERLRRGVGRIDDPK